MGSLQMPATSLTSRAMAGRRSRRRRRRGCPPLPSVRVARHLVVPVPRERAVRVLRFEEAAGDHLRPRARARSGERLVLRAAVVRELAGGDGARHLLTKRGRLAAVGHEAAIAVRVGRRAAERGAAHRDRRDGIARDEPAPDERDDAESAPNRPREPHREEPSAPVPAARVGRIIGACRRRSLRASSRSTSRPSERRARRARCASTSAAPV